MEPSLSRFSVSVLAVAGAFTLTACKPAPATDTAVAPMVDVAPVIYEKVMRWEAFNGHVDAVDSVDIRPRVTGHIVRVAFKEGELVAKGDLLFVIDPRSYQIALDNARARLERARVARRLARQQDERAKALFSERATSRQEAEERAATFAQTVAEVKSAEAAVKSAELELEFTKVRTPVTGRTSRAAITVGNMAVADQTILTSVVSQDPVYVYFNPDEQDYIRIKDTIAEHETIAIAPKVRVGLAGDDKFPYEAKIDLIDNRVDSSTGTIRMRAVVSNREDRFLPGMFARVQVGFTTNFPVVLVSDRAIQTDQNRKYVYVIDTERKAMRRYVEAGHLVNGLRIIDRGLSNSDQIVVGGIQRIYASDMKVEPHPVTMRSQPSDDSASQIPNPGQQE